MSDYLAQPTPDPDHLVETPQTLQDDDTESPRDDRGSGAEDHPLGAEKFGTTHAEAEEGESLDMRLAEEEPEIDAQDPLDDILAEGTEETDDEVLGAAYADPEDDVVPRNETDLPAEEAAMHVLPDA